jgi:phospholipid/cholesterol/gamma-HCH transport system substrate-binding protein
MYGAREIRVGFFALLALAAAVYYSMATSDNPFKQTGYTLHARFDTAEGLAEGSAVEMAGVSIGAVRDVRVEEGRAVLDLSMSPDHQLPVDSRAVIAARGLLGDTVIKISSGTSDTMLKDGDWLIVQAPPPSLADLQEEIGVIAQDVKAITGSLRVVLDSEETRGQISAILTNIEAFTKDLRGISQENRGDLDAVVGNLRRLSEELNAIATENRPEIDAEVDAIRKATDTLQRSLDRVESIAGKIDEGQGTLGRLVNDDALVGSVERTVDDISELVSSINRFQLEVYYRGEFHVTHSPGTAAFGGKNYLGLRIKPKPDYWYIFEFVDDPLGDFSEEILFTDGGAGFSSVREVRRTDKLQFSFQFAKRFRDLVLRLGIKENAGAVGADLFLLRDHLTVSLDVFDFTWASWPRQNGIPNVKLAVDIVPFRHMFLTAGVDNLINGIVQDRFTWFVGAGIWFTDNDVKWVVSSLPSGAL